MRTQQEIRSDIEILKGIAKESPKAANKPFFAKKWIALHRELNEALK